MLDTETDFQKTAEFVKGLILDAIDSGFSPPNAPSTIAKKGFDHPLIETGDMRDSLEARVEGRKIHVGFFDEENAKKAVINNYGILGKIPARPFMEQPIDENLDAIAEVATGELLERILNVFRR